MMSAVFDIITRDTRYNKNDKLTAKLQQFSQIYIYTTVHFKLKLAPKCCNACKFVSN